MLQHRHLGDDEPDAEGWVAVTGSGGVVKEVKERTVKSREEKEERLETEDIQHLGDISDDVSTVYYFSNIFHILLEDNIKRCWQDLTAVL